MAIRYKIVTRIKENNVSCIAPGKYELIYKKGTTVEAIKGTLGIFCFKTRKDAERFIIALDNPFLDYRIIRVGVLNKGRVPTTIGFFPFLDTFYNTKTTPDPLALTTKNIPKGTICYPKVKVLD